MPAALRFIPIIFLALLTGCEDREVARKRNEDRLPAGCRIIDLDYGELRAAVVCEDRKTTTVRASDIVRACDAASEWGEGIKAERAAIAAEARRYAGHYPEASDGRNTFIMLAEWIERR